MAKGSDVLAMLRPNGGWLIRGNDYSGIEWISCEPISEKEFLDGFDKYDAWFAAEEDAKNKAKKAAESKLAALGLTKEDLNALGF